MTIKFEVISDSDREHFGRQVEEYLKAGYKLHGSMVVTQHHYVDGRWINYYNQCMLFQESSPNG